MIAERYAANDIALYGEIIRLGRLGNASALATVIESAGSSPRKTGAKMLVRGDGSIMKENKPTNGSYPVNRMG